MDTQKTRFRIGKAVVDHVTLFEVIEQIKHILQSPRSPQGPYVIATPNAQFVYLAGHDERFARLMESVDLSVADGVSLIMASRALGNPLPDRITGVGLTEDICAVLGQQGGSVYLLGGLPGAAVGAANALQARYPGLRIAGTDCPPLGFEKTQLGAQQCFEKIQSAKPDLLLVGLGAPKQEYWIEDNRSRLPAKIVMGVGGTFDMLSGQRRRAPKWMQALGVEWLYRLLIEPTRLGRRCFESISYILWVFLKQFLANIFTR